MSHLSPDSLFERAAAAFHRYTRKTGGILLQPSRNSSDTEFADGQEVLVLRSLRGDLMAFHITKSGRIGHGRVASELGDLVLLDPSGSFLIPRRNGTPLGHRRSPGTWSCRQNTKRT